MPAAVLNVSRLIDDRPLGRLGMVVITLSALINLLDGMDTQSIGVAAPFIAHTLGLPPAAFGPIFSAALFGAALGAILFGAIADRVGRRRLLILATLTFGLFTLATAHAGSVDALVVFRFFAGVGLGGATPCFIALTSEYAPARHRATCVTVMWAGFPLGAMLGAFANSLLITDYGWRAIFYIGGVLPLVLAVALTVWLPESLKFLLTRGARSSASVLRILARLGATDVGAETILTVDEEKLAGLPLRHVFSDGRAIATLLLWVPFFMGFGILTVAVLWTPTLLRLNGISPAATAFVVAFNGLGGAIGMAAAGRLIERFGIVTTLVPSFVIGGLATAGLGFGASSVAAAATFIGLIGFFIGIASAGAIALAALIYPTAIRSTGVGLGMAVGRFGQVVSPLIAGAMLAARFDAGEIMLAMAFGALIGAVFVVLFKLRLTRSPAGLDTRAETELA